MSDEEVDRNEFVYWMVKLKQRDPETYERIKADAWEMVADNHKRKTPDEIAEWMRGAS